jgi:hypothetical protein
MLEKRKMLMDAEAEQARQSALDWIEELGRMDWPSGGIDSRLASGYDRRKCRRVQEQQLQSIARIE